MTAIVGGDNGTFAGHRYEHFAVTASTNDLLKADWERSEFLPRIVTADHQTRGRGRGDRTWLDHPGSTLCLSFSLRLHRDDARVPWLSLLGGLAGFAAVRVWCPHDDRLFVKWPNDLYAGVPAWRKLAGVLVETACIGPEIRIVVGIGMNVQSLESRAPLASIAVADLMGVCASGATVQPADLVAPILAAWHRWWQGFDSSRFLAAFAASMGPTIGARVSWSRSDGTAGAGTVCGVDGAGRLLVAESAKDLRSLGDDAVIDWERLAPKS